MPPPVLLSVYLKVGLSAVREALGLRMIGFSQPRLPWRDNISSILIYTVDKQCGLNKPSSP